MAVALSGLGTYTAGASASTHTLSVSWGGGNGVVVVGVSMEASQTISGVTCNGTSMALAASVSHSVTPNNKLHLYTLNFTAAASSYNVVVTLSSSTVDISYGVWRVDGANSTLNATATAEAGTATATVTTTIAAVPDGAVLAVAQSASGAVTWNSYAGVTERSELNEANYTSTFADSLTTATETRTVSATASDVTGNKVMAVLSFSPTGGGGGSTVRRRTVLRAPKNTQRAFKPVSRVLMGATRVVDAPPPPAVSTTPLDRRRRRGWT